MAWEPIKKEKENPTEIDFGAGVMGVLRTTNEIEGATDVMEVLRFVIRQDKTNPEVGGAEIAWNPTVFALYKQMGQLGAVAQGLRDHADVIDKLHAEWEKEHNK
jgi:hypothetical protein